MTIFFLQKLIRNLSTNHDLRKLFAITLVSLLNNDTKGAILRVQLMGKGRSDCYVSSKEKVSPHHILIVSSPDISQLDLSNKIGMFRRRHGGSAAADIAAKLPASAQGSKEDKYLPTIAARQIIHIFVSLKRLFLISTWM